MAPRANRGDDGIGRAKPLPDSASASVARHEVVAYLGLGANLDDPVGQVRAAHRELQQDPEFTELAFSSLYRSAPMGPPNQPDYVNAVMAVVTRLRPEELLAKLHRIEHAHGRIRAGEHWGPRTLDLDLLLYGGETISTPTLQVPHPGIAEREFVLIPLLEIAPALKLPDGRKLGDLLPDCPRRSCPLVRIEATDD